MSSLCHLTDQGVGGLQRGDVVDLHDPSFLTRPFTDARVVHENVDTTKGRHGTRCQIGAGSGLRQIGLDSDGTLELTGDSLEVSRRAGGEYNACSFGRQHSRGVFADPSACTGDQGCPPVQLAHLVSLFPRLVAAP